jgi:hypothetical protein
VYDHSRLLNLLRAVTIYYSRVGTVRSTSPDPSPPILAVTTTLLDDSEGRPGPYGTGRGIKIKRSVLAWFCTIVLVRLGNLRRWIQGGDPSVCGVRGLGRRAKDAILTVEFVNLRRSISDHPSWGYNRAGASKGGHRTWGKRGRRREAMFVNKGGHGYSKGSCMTREIQSDRTDDKVTDVEYLS